MVKQYLVVRKISMKRLREMSSSKLIKRDMRLSTIDFRLRTRRKGLPWSHHAERNNLTKRITRAGNERKKVSKVLKEKRRKKKKGA